MASAPLVPLTLVGPGIAGLNTQTASTLLGPEWATEAKNMVFDDAGRLSARLGWASITSTPMSGNPEPEHVFEYLTLAGASTIVSAAGNKLWSGTTAPADITGAVTVTANNWQFQNYNGNVVALQASHALITWNGAGNFANVTAASGTVPNGNCLLAAFGRLWGTTSDGQTLKYCGLLDQTNWGAAGSGSFNLTHVWSNGVDQIQAVAQFESFLVVFGKRHVILIEDGSGSIIGLDPLNAQVSKVIAGVGCIARDSIQTIDGNDLFFLSNSGLQSLVRAIELAGNPTRDVSKNIRDTFMVDVAQTTLSQIRSTYNPRRGFYLLLLPGATNIYCFNTKLALPDETLRITEWTSFIPRSLLTLVDGVTLYCGKAGKIYNHANNLDDAAAYRIIYNSGWLVVNEEVRDRLKMLKKIASIVFINGAANIVYKWGFDFRDLNYSLTKTTSSGNPGAEWGLGEFGLGEFGGSVGLNEFEIPGLGSGQFIKIGVECDINNTELALQQLQLFCKVGRLT
jgi:hypothetical protein